MVIIIIIKIMIIIRGATHVSVLCRALPWFALQGKAMGSAAPQNPSKRMKSTSLVLRSGRRAAGRKMQRGGVLPSCLGKERGGNRRT
jgi:hypothetical protein